MASRCPQMHVFGRLLAVLLPICLTYIPLRSASQTLGSSPYGRGVSRLLLSRVVRKSRLDSKMLAEMEKGPHTGPADEALIGIQVTGFDASGAPIKPRYGNGFVIRCDGFILVPFNIFDSPITTVNGTAARSKNMTMTFFLNPGSDHEKRIVMPREPRYFHPSKRNLGMAAFKLSEPVHVPALRTLVPEKLKLGDAVEVVWRNWDVGTRAFGKVNRRPAKIGKLPDGAAANGVVDSSEANPGRIRFEDPIDGVPPGAIVLDLDGMALGIVQGGQEGKKADGFTSFAYQDLITNCVGATQTPDSSFTTSFVEGHKPEKSDEQPPVGGKGAANISAPAAGQMVKVPGGPVFLPRNLMAEQPDLDNEPIACVAPFQIDALEVTNEEYFAFLKALDDKKRASTWFRRDFYPHGWSPIGPPYPPELGGLPVIGVPLAGAKAYAQAHGKRLPTPYEWVKAALGPKGDATSPEWMTRYIRDRRQAWNSLLLMHRQYLADHRMGPNLHATYTSYPWIGDDLDAEQFSYMAITRVMNSLIDSWASPLSVIPVGSRSYDVSPYGARDMLLNAYEMYLPNPGAPFMGEMRYFLTDWYFSDLEKPFTFPNGTLTTYPNGQDVVHFPPLNYSIESGSSWPWDAGLVSRLYKRTVSPLDYVETYDARVRPAKDYITLVSNINFARVMTLPLLAGELIIGDRSEFAASIYPLSPPMVPSGKAAESSIRQYAAELERYLHYLKFPSTIWSSATLHYSRETGYPPAQQTLPVVPPERDNYIVRKRVDGTSEQFPKDLFYILPVGFRCAR